MLQHHQEVFAVVGALKVCDGLVHLLRQLSELIVTDAAVAQFLQLKLEVDGELDDESVEAHLLEETLAHAGSRHVALLLLLLGDQLQLDLIKLGEEPRHLGDSR